MGDIRKSVLASLAEKTRTSIQKAIQKRRDEHRDDDSTSKKRFKGFVNNQERGIEQDDDSRVCTLRWDCRVNHFSLHTGGDLRAHAYTF